MGEGAMSGPWDDYQPKAKFNLRGALAETDEQLGLPKGYSAAQIKVESAFKPDAKSPAGAMGLAQVMPATLKTLSQRMGRRLDPYSPEDSVLIHREVMRENLAKFKNPDDAARAYNSGWSPERWSNPETAAYAGKIRVAMGTQPNPVMTAVGSAVNAVVPSAQAATPQANGNPWDDYKPATKAAITLNPTDSMGTFDRAAAGLGKSIVDTGRGVGQLLGLVNQTDIDEAAKRDKALMDTTAGMLGNVGGQVAQIALPGAAATKGVQMAGLGGKLLAGGAKGAIARAAGSGAAFAASQPVLTGDSRAENIAVGGFAGGAGQGLVSGVQALAKPAAAAMSPAVSNLAAKAEAMGIPISAAQLSDSKFVKTLASTLEKLPFTGAGATRTAQQQSFNRAVSKTFGEDSPAITQEVYATAKKRIGSEFERLSLQNNLGVGDDLLNKLGALQDEAQRFGSNDTARAVTAAIDELLSKAGPGGVVPGKAYQSLDSKLGKLTKTGDEKALYLGQVRDAVRGAMDDSISTGDQAAWKLAREQYKNLKTIRDLVAKEGADGNISPALLAGRMNSSQAGKEAMAMGRGGEMGDLARIGQQFLKDKIPDSGTAGRLAAMGALGSGGYMLGVDPQTLLMTAAGGATAGRGLNALLNSSAGRGFMLNGSQSANRLAQLLAPAPYVATPLALEAAR